MSAENSAPLVGIIMGSESDMPAMEPCMKQLEEFGVSYEVKVASAHRRPARCTSGRRRLSSAAFA